jgi:hypothetical protein
LKGSTRFDTEPEQLFCLLHQVGAEIKNSKSGELNPKQIHKPRIQKTERLCSAVLVI